MDNIIIETFNHITVCYNTSWVDSVKLMIKEHYDTPEYDNTIVFINYWLDENNPFYNSIKQSFKRRIFYFMEHKTNDEDYYNCGWYNFDTDYIDYLRKSQYITEIWSMDYMPQLAVRCEQELGIPLKYRPVRYTSLIKPVDNIYTTPKTVDFCLVGIIGPYATNRENFIANNEHTHNFSLKVITQCENMQEIIPELNLSRYIIDMPRLKEQITQNQVRIFELLCMGYTMCIQKYKTNIFPGLIYEWETVDDLKEIVKRGEYLHPTEAYKEMTYTDEAYEKYVNNLIEQWNTLG